MSEQWHPAPVVTQFFKEMNAMFPHRDHASDGIVGDASHAARPSEHNPCWTCTGRNHGVVRALDVDIDDGDPTRDLRTMTIKETVGDPRVWYVISNGIIRSRTFNWVPRRYTGVNGHFHHVHISFLWEGLYDTRPFFSEDKPVRVKPVFLDMSDLQDEFLRVLNGGKPKANIPVKRYQRLINARLGSTLVLDGEVGPRTLRLSGALEAKFGGTGRPRVPDPTLLTNANAGMYRLVA